MNDDYNEAPNAGSRSELTRNENRIPTIQYEKKNTLDQAQTFSHLIKAMADQADTINKLTDNSIEYQRSYDDLEKRRADIQRLYEEEKEKVISANSLLIESNSKVDKLEKDIVVLKTTLELTQNQLNEYKNRKNMFQRVFKAIRE